MPSVRAGTGGQEVLLLHGDCRADCVGSQWDTPPSGQHLLLLRAVSVQRRPFWLGGEGCRWGPCRPGLWKLASGWLCDPHIPACVAVTHLKARLPFI